MSRTKPEFRSRTGRQIPLPAPEPHPDVCIQFGLSPETLGYNKKYIFWSLSRAPGQSS